MLEAPGKIILFSVLSRPLGTPSPLHKVSRNRMGGRSTHPLTTSMVALLSTIDSFLSLVLSKMKAGNHILFISTFSSLLA